MVVQLLDVYMPYVRPRGYRRLAIASNLPNCANLFIGLAVSKPRGDISRNTAPRCYSSPDPSIVFTVHWDDIILPEDF